MSTNKENQLCNILECFAVEQRVLNKLPRQNILDIRFTIPKIHTMFGLVMKTCEHQ